MPLVLPPAVAQFTARLNEPFPEASRFRDKLLGAAGTGGFIAAFLIVFQPFGFHTAPNPGALASAFGAVTTIAMVSYEVFFRLLLKIKTDVPSWTLWKWLTSVAGLLTWIALGNFTLLAILYPGYTQSAEYFLLVWRNTVLIGLIPTAVFGLLVQLRATEHFRAQAKELHRPTSHANQTLTVEFSLNQEQTLALCADDVLYIEAMQNYISVYYFERGQDLVEKAIVRDTLQNALTQLIGSTTVRCHRSYLVNYTKVVDISGNAQGLKLSLAHLETDVTIPVSRSYVADFRALMA